MTIAEQAKQLYDTAVAADEAFSKACEPGGRWSSVKITAEVRAAYKAKLAADEAWLLFMRQQSEARTASSRTQQ